MKAKKNLTSENKVCNSKLEKQNNPLQRRGQGEAKKIIYLLTLLAVSLDISAQDSTSVMRSEGKINVVILVAAIILGGIFFYLIRMDRKISRIEKEQKNL